MLQYFVSLSCFFWKFDIISLQSEILFIYESNKSIIWYRKHEYFISDVILLFGFHRNVHDNKLLCNFAVEAATLR